MCLLVIRATSTNLAKSSLSELDRLCELFEEAAGKGSQIASNNAVRIFLLSYVEQRVLNCNLCSGRCPPDA